LALSNHKKSKHSNDYDSFKLDDYSEEFCKKKRGRPKKKSSYKISDFPEVHFNLFFESEFRKKKNRENLDVKKYLIKILHDLNNFPNETFTKKIQNFNEYPLLVVLNRKNEKELNFSNTCDQVWVKYLEEISLITNSEYFLFLTKVLVLFRECINKYKNIELENSIIILNEKIPKDVSEFTQFYDCEQVPEICNEFLSDYLEMNNFFGITDDYINELIPLIQHFCYWLFLNNYTSSRLSLV
jgi:hypothetical protein